MIIHTVNTFGNTDRHSRARKSWERLDFDKRVYQKAYMGVSPSILGDSVYVRDIVEAGIGVSSSGDDIIVMNNSDSYLVTDALRVIRTMRIGVSQRLGTGKALKIGVDSVEAKQRYRYGHGGIDLVFFTVDWWNKWKSWYPNVLIGMVGWDWIFKFMIGEENETGGQLVVHEDHGTPGWISDPRNKYNEKLCWEWANRWGMDRLIQRWPTLTSYSRS